MGQIRLTRPAKLFVFVLLWLAPLAGAVPVAAGRELATGVSFMSDVNPVAFEHVAATGSTFVQSPLVWPQVAPKKEPPHWDPSDPADPHYDWRAVDAWVTAAVRQGLEPVLQVSGAPPWAEGCAVPGMWETSVCAPDPTKLADFARAASLRYSGRFGGLPRVRFWQGLNEPNLGILFRPQFEGGKAVSAGLYRKLVNAFYFAVKSSNPTDLVLAAGLSPIARPGSTVGPMRFARELLCMAGRADPHPLAGDCEGGVHFDVFDIHPYTTGGPTHKGHVDDVELGDLSKLQELLGAADRAGRIEGRFPRTPLWITELSWDSKPPDPGGLPMSILKRWTAEALYRAWDAGVSHFFWYSLRDEAPDPKRSFSETLESGLYFRGPSLAEDRPKPSMYAFRFPFVAYTQKGGFFYWGRTPTSMAGRVVLEVFESGEWRRAGVARASARGIFTGSVATAYGRTRHGRVRARFEGEESAPFSLQPVRDFHQAPFGNPVG
ncbi:MAG TPA: hypothetical protein VFL77_08530 [Solirubrobacterales bacterium]|nr:hypothetical protein [Solirubrobacterales bacterium]